MPCISTATQNADPNDVGVTSAMTNTSQQIGASIGTALLNTIAASATAAYLASHRTGGDLVARATVHGYATASAWAAGIFVLAGLRSPGSSSTCIRGVGRGMRATEAALRPSPDRGLLSMSRNIGPIRPTAPSTRPGAGRGPSPAMRVPFEDDNNDEEEGP